MEMDLMTAMVMLDAHLPMDEILAVTEADVDKLKGSSSKLPVGSELTRQELLHMALMSSENRAASALGRNFPGGETAFIAAMNAKAIARVTGTSMPKLRARKSVIAPLKKGTAE